MNNPSLALKERVVIRLVSRPETLDMRSFSARPRTKSKRNLFYGLTFCLAGLILDESQVGMQYDSRGAAVALAKGEAPPSRQWVDHELSLAENKVKPSLVVIAAKARELWAAEYGDAAAKLLMFYEPEWNARLEDVTAEQVVQFLQVVNVLAAHSEPALAA